MGFHIQRRSISHEIWVIPDRYDWRDHLVRSERSSDLVAAIHAVADERTLSHPDHIRIVTDDGDPVSRWKDLAGSREATSRSLLAVTAPESRSGLSAFDSRRGHLGQ